MSKKTQSNDTAANQTAPAVTAMNGTPSASVVGELKPEQEKELKARHGRLGKIRVKAKDGTTHVCYCKYPDRNIFALAMSKRGKDQILEAGEAVLDNCFVGGDEQIKSNDSLRISAALQCYDLLDFLEASSEEL